MLVPDARDSYTSATQPGSLEVLSQEIDVDNLEGHYRIKIGDGAVRYLTVAPNVYQDSDTMANPRLFLPSLPPLPPPNTWTTMEIFRKDGSSDGPIETRTSSAALPSRVPVWHDDLVDVLSLPRIGYCGPRTKEVLYRGRPAIAKIARFPWEIGYVETETLAYLDVQQALEKDEVRGDGEIEEQQRREPQGGQRLPTITPRFLGHLTENGRVMGFLLEKVEGTYAGIDDLRECAAALKRLHAMGIVHGDVNRHNFIVGHGGGEGEEGIEKRVWMLDLEHADLYSKQSAQRELDSLEAELREETGRGRKGGN
ncbi:MAG: hypothetical protein M1837_001633 [Sclerophora amabilis]|nr:MAG: hypothetical protein M1837_001633 [Sclerophora amabilis]